MRNLLYLVYRLRDKITVEKYVFPDGESNPGHGGESAGS